MSMWWTLFLVWAALQVVAVIRNRLAGPPPPPGGRVKAVHNEEEWAAALKEAEADSKLLVVDFTASWCGPCRRFTPFYEQLSDKFPGVNFLKVDVDVAKSVAASCKVSFMPTFHLYKGKQLLEQWSGADERRLEAAVVKHA